MLKKIEALLLLLRCGQAVTDPAKWKKRQITTSMVVAILWALVSAAPAFGVDVPLDAETADALAVGILAVVNGVLTLTTSEKVGL